MFSGEGTHIAWMWVWILVVAVAWIAFFAYLSSRAADPTHTNREGLPKKPSAAETREEELGETNASEGAKTSAASLAPRQNDAARTGQKEGRC